MLITALTSCKAMNNDIDSVFAVTSSFAQMKLQSTSNLPLGIDKSS